MLRVYMGRGGWDLGWLNLRIFYFLSLSGGIYPGVRHIIDVVAPRAYISDSVGACFSTRTGVNIWLLSGVFLCLGLGFSRRG